MIASRDLERANWCCQQYGVGKPVEGYQALIDSEEIDAVYLSLPPSMHAQWSIAAAQSGKHVLCEKPLTMNLSETLRLDAACRQHGVRWLDATGWLHHSRTDAFRNWITDGELGAVGHVAASVSFFEPFQSNEHRLDASLGGGCLLDLGWYVAGAFVFAALSVNQTLPPTRVSAHAVMHSGVPKRLTAVVQSGCGMTASLSCGYDTATRKWFEIAGSKASLICDDFTRPWLERPTRCWIHDATGTAQSHEFEDQQEQRMIEKFIGTEDLRSDQNQAISTQAVLDALQRSVETGQWQDVNRGWTF